MKNIVITLCSGVLIGVLILIAYTLHGRTIRQTELNNALTSGLEKTMEMLQAEEEYAPQSNEEFISDFLQAFVPQIDSSSDVKVHILDADYEKGLLSVEAVLNYRHPIGTEGHVSVQKTMILEQYETRAEEEYFSIQFMSDGKVFKLYRLEKGRGLLNPGIPKKEGKTFKGWRELDGESIVTLTELKAEQDMTYVAVFE